MRLRGFHATNWMAHAHLDLELSPLTIIAGGNDAGKTSVVDGMTFALLGTLPRVYSKADRGQLVRDGAEKGVVALAAGTDWAVTRSINSGQMKTTGTHPQEADPLDPIALAYLFDPARFGAADPDTKRQLLMSVSKEAITREKVMELLKKRGHAAELVDQLPDVGIADMVNFCKEKAAESRGEWRAAAGRTYGDKIGGEWKMDAPEDAGDPVELRAAYEAKLELANKARGALAVIDAGNEQANAHNARLEDLRRVAGNLATHEATLAEIMQEVLPDLETAERSVRVLDGIDDTELACPGCGSVLVLVDGALEHSNKPATLPSAADQKRIRDIAETARKAVADHNTRKANVEREIAESKSAQVSLDQIETVQGNGTKATANRDAAYGAVAAAAQEEVAAQRAWEAARDARAGIEAANERNAKARAAHEAVQAWAKMATALEPGGIPGELLEQTLKPFNDMLRDLAGAFRWPQAAIRPDMEITSDGRLYNLVSESRQWRTDTMLAIMLARFSNAKFVVLDRFDVLEVPARKPALETLYKLTKKQELDTALVIGTFKNRPAVPKDVQVHWFGPEPAAA